MTKPKGGRCKRLPYSTTTVRIPEPLKPVVEKMVQDFEEGKYDSCSTGEVYYLNENGEVLTDEITLPMPAGCQHFICVRYVR
jgi:hypothetical protein